ncbi:MAG: hypothetical protein J6I80_00550 [Clostridia bacterium]|nr:hypothetical protein [Clostridia bacterium]
MKKLITILLCFAMIICFAGCGNKKENLELSVTFSQSSPADNGVSIHLAECDLNGENPYLDIEWINSSDKEQTFGMQFNIYRVDNGNLTSCATEELFFNEIACILNPKASHIERYHLEAFDLREVGTYRFVPEDFPGRKLWVEFEIKNTAVSNVGGVDSKNVTVITQ